MKKVLITAGPVYGALDDNKLVSNRVRGIWAAEFARLLCKWGYEVTLLVADTWKPPDWTKNPCATMGKLLITTHKGFDEYMAECLRLAPLMDAAVMAAAVVNWIPASPFDGKMPTEGYEENQVINIPFRLAPNVIQRMKKLNPRLTLIGCKMLSGATEEQLLDTAYDKVLLKARCNLVIANDMRLGLRKKWQVYPDRSSVLYDDEFPDFMNALKAVIDDEHYRTVLDERPGNIHPIYLHQFDRIVELNRDRFVRPVGGRDMVFGSLAVQVPGWGWLCSPREKGSTFTSKDAVLVSCIADNVVRAHGGKATLNAPLLIRVGEKHGAHTVLHLHEQLPDVPTLGYAPPGTYRDNNRELLPNDRTFNIEGHGFISCL